MGKASSSKKVARAARAAASSRPGERRNLGFPAVVAGVVVLGVLLVVFARSTRDAAASPRIGEHWHSTYDIFVCDDYDRDPVLDETDPVGIHTHGDGLIHIHPFASAAAGDNARISVWFESFGGSIDDEGIVLDDGRTYTEGEDCNGEPTVFSLLRYDAANLGDDPEVITEDIADTHFLRDGEAFVLAFVPEGADLPEPSQGRLDGLVGVSGDLTSGNTTTTTVAGGEEPADDSTDDAPVEGDAGGEATTTTAG